MTQRTSISQQGDRANQGNEGDQDSFFASQPLQDATMQQTSGSASMQKMMQGTVEAVGTATSSEKPSFSVQRLLDDRNLSEPARNLPSQLHGVTRG